MTHAVEAIAWPSARRRLLVLVGLSGFAISQPLLSVLGDEPTILVRYGIEGGSLVAFALLVAVVPPLVLWVVTEACRLVMPRGGRAAHLVVVGVLAASFAVQVAKEIGLDGRVGLLVVAAVVGAGFAVAYGRIRIVATWAAYTAVLPALAVGVFALASPASALLQPRSEPPARVAGADEQRSVIVIVLDELPTRSLLDDMGGIDRVRYPNLAALGDDATWYRHQTSLASYTTVAVPSLLTGQNPQLKEALWTSYPDNLFTLLAPTHELEVLETATSLCPYSTCAPTTGGDEAAVSSTLGLGDLLGVTADLWRDRVSLGPAAPPALDDFAEQAVPGSSAASGLVDDDRRLEDPEAQLRLSSARVETFTRSFDADKGPALYYLHLMLPHQPWLRWPDGEAYEVDDPFGVDLPAEDAPYFFSWSAWNAAVTEQRHLLQAQYADRQVGVMLDALRAEGLYDDSLVIVTSDHGVSFEERSEARLVAPSTLDAIAYAPLLIKLPGQVEAVVDDTNIMAIDLVPTIADQLGIPLSWEADGVAAGSAGIAARGDRKVLYDLEGVYELDLAGILEFSDRDTFATVADRWIGPLAPGDDVLAGLDRRLPLDGILGQSFDDLGATPGGEVRIASIERLRRPEGTPLAVVTGQVAGAPTGGTFVLAVNDRVVAGSALSQDSSGRSGLVTVLLPEGILEDSNEIRAALVTADGIVELRVMS